MPYAVRLRLARLSGLSLVLCASAACAVDYQWNGGAYSTAGLPTTLQAGDALSVANAASQANPVLDLTLTSAAAITVNTGSFYGTTGALLDNSGTFALAVDGNLLTNTGSWNFTNEAGGTVSKTGGTGSSVFDNGVVFVNNGGTILAQSGTLQFGGSATTFNAGTTFAGLGTTLVNGTASFNDSYTVQPGANLNLEGTLVGASSSNAPAGVVISGTTSFLGGHLGGTWTLAPGGMFNVSSSPGGGNPVFANATFNNAGTASFSGPVYGGASTFTNQLGAAVIVNGDGYFASQSPWSFINTGALIKNGSGTWTFGAGLSFTNNGAAIAINGGTLTWAGTGNTFSNNTLFEGGGTALVSGTSAFQGVVSVAPGTTLNLQGTNTGTGSVLMGTANFQGGNLSGDWSVSQGAVLNVSSTPGGGNPHFSGSLGNSGTLNLGTDVSSVSGQPFALTNNPTGVVNLSSDSVINGNQDSWTLFNAGLILKSGTTGTSTLNGNTAFTNAPTGVLQVDSGTLYSKAGPFLNAGTLSWGISAPATNGVMEMAYNTALGGSFAAVLLGSYRPAVGAVFDVMNFDGGYSGTFLNATYTVDGITFVGIYLPTRFELQVGSVAAVPEAPTWLMLLAGIAVMSARIARRQRPVSQR